MQVAKRRIRIADVLTFNVGVVLSGYKGRLHIEGTGSRKLLVLDRSMAETPDLMPKEGEFVVITAITGDSKPGLSDEGVFFCKTRPLSPREVSPRLCDRNASLLRLNNSMPQRYSTARCHVFKPFAKLVDISGGSGNLVARVELRYRLEYHDPECPFVGGLCSGTWVECRELPLKSHDCGRTTELSYRVYINYADSKRDFPLFLSSCERDVIWDELWDEEMVRVPMIAADSALLEIALERFK